MTSEVAIRASCLKDLQPLWEIASGCAEAPQWTTAMWRQVLISAARGKRTVLIAESEGDVIGFAVASIAGDEVEIESVAVAPAARRRGIGCRLCEELLDWARAQGAARVALEVRISNGVARALYGALGFQERGVRRRYYEAPREDAIVMVWKPNR